MQSNGWKYWENKNNPDWSGLDEEDYAVWCRRMQLPDWLLLMFFDLIQSSLLVQASS